jgi:hypothetical protein
LIVGIPAIARILDLGEATVKRDLLKRPGFPASKLGLNGPWITTREKLIAWINTQLPGPPAAS